MAIDVHSFRDFGDSLRASVPVVAKESRAALYVLAGSVAHDAQFLIQGVSASIPPTIKPRVAKVFEAQVVAGGGSATPIAGLMEMGGKQGGGGNTVQWNHPVWGNQAVQVTQQGHPYMGPAIHANAARIETVFWAVMDKALLTAAGRD